MAGEWFDSNYYGGKPDRGFLPLVVVDTEDEAHAVCDALEGECRDAGAMVYWNPREDYPPHEWLRFAAKASEWRDLLTGLHYEAWRGEWWDWLPFALAREALKMAEILQTGGQAREATGKPRKGKRGPYKTDYDGEADRKLAEDWQAAKRSGLRTIAEFCKKRGLNAADVRAAIERDRKRK